MRCSTSATLPRKLNLRKKFRPQNGGRAQMRTNLPARTEFEYSGPGLPGSGHLFQAPRGMNSQRREFVQRGLKILDNAPGQPFRFRIRRALMEPARLLQRLQSVEQHFVHPGWSDAPYVLLITPVAVVTVLVLRADIVFCV